MNKELRETKIDTICFTQFFYNRKLFIVDKYCMRYSLTSEHIIVNDNHYHL